MLEKKLKKPLKKKEALITRKQNISTQDPHQTQRINFASLTESEPCTTFKTLKITESSSQIH